jgi:hypothetical protein
MQFVLWRIERVIPYDRNPRQNDVAVDAVAASVREFGFRQPIVVDEHGVIIAGHTRWKAALKLGLAKVPVHVAKDLTPAQIRPTESPTIRRTNWPSGTRRSCRWSWQTFKRCLRDCTNHRIEPGALAAASNDPDSGHDVAPRGRFEKKR